MPSEPIAPCILISAGEASGDMYAARLATELVRRTGAHLFGMGGPRMDDAGVELIAHSSDVAVSGVSEVWGKLSVLRQTMRSLLAASASRRPKLAILTDFPSFHLRLARGLQARGVRCVCFVAPQFWAWRPWRAKQIAKRFVHALCIFPFEEEFYRKYGATVSFIGHPLVDIVKRSMPRAEFLTQQKIDASNPVIALLPGSRMNEIQHNLPAILGACSLIQQKKPDCQFILALAAGTAAQNAAIASGETAAGTLRIRSGRTEHAFQLPAGLNLGIVTGMTYDAVASATAAIVASGTATVETALLGTPMVVVYRVARLTEFILRRFVVTPYFAMPNLVADRKIVPELFQQDCSPQRVSQEILRLLDSPDARAEMQAGLSTVRQRLGPGGAIERAADIIVGVL
jgi:lipid-A-disaccharide synthase